MLAHLMRSLLDPSGLTPHGFCLLWDPALIWMHAGSDAAIGLAYFSIPVALAMFARRRRDLVFRPVFLLSAGFILLCGAGHWLDLLTLWVPVYWIDGLIKVATAATSVVTAVAMWRLLPEALALPSPGQLREANTALRETNRQMLMAERIAGVGSWRLELTGPQPTQQWSAEVFRIYGLDPDGPVPDLAGAIAAYHPDDRAVVERSVAQAIAEAREFSMQVRLIRPDGQVRHVQAQGMPELAPDGTVLALFGVFLDITDRRVAEEVQARLHELTLRARDEAEASNARLTQLAAHLEIAREGAERASFAKSRFLASMSHELRTPLNGVLGYAELLRLEGGLDARQTSRLDAMTGAGTHLLQMINRVLDLSEIEAERIELRVSTFDPHDVATQCLDLVRPAAESQGLSLAFEGAADRPTVFCTDVTRLRQILLNLLGNAVKFSATGTVTLRLRGTDGGAGLRFEVADRGPGIPVAQRHRLFREFARLEHSADAVEGAGLGLALSARLAALLGGALGYDDNPGGGSVFWVQLPPMAAPAREMAASSAATAVAAPAPGLRVLVVDDSAMNREIVENFLHIAGHAVTCAGSGAEAVAAAAAADFDAVLMDVRMPGMDGLEATRRIRALAAPRGAVPIVGLTAQAFAEQTRLCAKAGMDAHLTKPFTVDSLLTTVTRAATTCRPRDGYGGGDVPLEASPAPGGTPVTAGLSILNGAAFDRIAACLTQEAVATHLRTLSREGGSLLARLRMPGALGQLGSALAVEAHALAGGFSMFGFERLAAVAIGFEHAVRAGAADAATLAETLEEVLDATLEEVERRVA